MKITTLLFDLDGTLLPMDQDTFAKAYVTGLSKTAGNLEYEPMSFAAAVMKGTEAMVKNNGEKTNEAVFWNELVKMYGKSVMDDYHMFDEFYETDFQKIKDVCGFEPKAADLIKKVKAKCFRIALATNPLFPKTATMSRIRWAGLNPDDFEIFTTYENSSYCKPNLDYYRDILNRMNVCPEECLMIGNDVSEDMIASKLGMRVFLLTDCLINKSNKDISIYPHGDFDALLKFIETL